MLKKAILESDVTYISDTEIQGLVQRYLQGEKSAIEPVFDVANNVFHSKLRPYKGTQWYRTNITDIQADFNLFFYDTLRNYNSQAGAFLAFLYSKIGHFINNVYYSYVAGADLLDRNLIALRGYLLKFTSEDPSLSSLSGEEFEERILELIVSDKAKNYQNEGLSEAEMRGKALASITSSGLKAAISYLPTLANSSYSFSLEQIREMDASFDLPANEVLTSSADLDTLLRMALGSKIWAAEGLLEYLDLQVSGETTLRKTAEDHLFSKEDFSKAVKESFSRMANPMIHYCYLNPVVIEDEEMLNKLSPEVFSDF